MQFDRELPEDLLECRVVHNEEAIFKLIARWNNPQICTRELRG